MENKFIFITALSIQYNTPKSKQPLLFICFANFSITALKKAPRRVLFVVEMAVIETASENMSAKLSTSVFCRFGFPSRFAGKQTVRYGSS